MLHELTWAQIVLFELGALFQFIAICTFVRERLEVRNRPPTQRHNHDYDDAGEPAPSRPQVSAAEHVNAYRILPAPRLNGTSQNISAAHLAKTAKVTFKQTFNSLRQD